MKDSIKRKISHTLMNHRVSIKTKLKISKSMLGNTNKLGKSPSIETRKRLSIAQTRKHHSLETKLKISKSLRRNKI